MMFVHPAFLWAFTALAIPVLIHLFQLRRFKRIDFPNVRFLAEVSKQTRARKKIQHWLVLLARLLALSCLILAFAQPYIPDPSGVSKAGPRAASLFVDDSYSMDGQNDQGRLLDQARKGAQDAVMGFGATGRYQVLSGRFEGRQQVLLGRDEAIEAISQTDASPFTRPLSQVITRQREALATSDAQVKRAFLFTDLQRSVTDVEQWTNDTLMPTVIVPIPPTRHDNLSIDSVWFESPVRRAGRPEVLHVRIRNYGDQELVNVPLRLSMNGMQRAMATFSVAGSGTVDTTLRFTSGPPGLYRGEVTIDDQPVTFDDGMFVSFRVSEKLRVLLISGGDEGGDKALSAVFDGDSTHRFTQVPVRGIDLAQLNDQDLILLNGLPVVPSGLAQALKAFVDGGGSVAVFPPADADATGHDDLFARTGISTTTVKDTTAMKVERIDLDKPFYREVFQTMPRNVDLPYVRQRWSLRVPAGSEQLLRLQDGTSFLARVDAGKGSLYICAAPLAEQNGNLIRHALFATSLLRMAELARPMGMLYHVIGAEALIPLDGIDVPGEQPPHLLGPEGMDLVPELRRLPGMTALVLHDQDLPDGIYALTQGADTLTNLALNRSRLESDLSTYSPDELTTELEQRGLRSFTVLASGTRDLSLRLSELDQGRKLWKWFILLALLFLSAEVFLIRPTR